MQKIIFKFSLVFLSVLLINPVHSTTKPFIYSAEKDGKTIHLLGTMHESVPIAELPCSNEILVRLNTSDLIFSELPESLLILLKYLGNNTKEIFMASVSEREGMLSNLPEYERESVSKIIESYNRGIIEALQTMFSGVQFVDKERESFEALSPQTRSLLISRGADVQESYVDYLHLIYQSVTFESFFSSPRLDFQIAEVAQSENIHIKPLDNASSITGHFIDAFFSQPEKAEEMEIAEMEIDSKFIDSLIASLSEIRNISNVIHSSLKEHYLSGNDEGILQNINTLSDKVQETLLKERNRVWFQKLKEAFGGHEYENIFLAGGATHLIGPFNLLDMLKEEGFAVKRLSCSEIM